MNPVTPARRRAEQFSSMVEDSSTVQLRAAGKHADLVPLVGLVTSLRATPPVEARPEFVADLRSRLMLAAETALAPDTAAQVEARRQPAPRRTSRERRLAVAVGGFALVSASASMSVAAQAALPGDTLYPLKRAIEDVHETVQRDADAKGTTMLDNASGRLDEVDELSRTDSQDPQVIANTLQDFADQAVEASGVLLDDYEKTGRLSSIEELRSFTASSLAALQQLENLVPAAVRDSLAAATEILGEIEREARSLCSACATLPSVIEAVSAAADLGPLYEELLEAAPTAPAPKKNDPAPTTPPPAPATTGGEPAGVTPPTAPPTAVDPDPDVSPTKTPGSDPEPGGPAPGPKPSLDTVVTGLGTIDLGDLLTGTTEAVGDLLGGGKSKTK